MKDIGDLENTFRTVAILIFLAIAVSSCTTLKRIDKSLHGIENFMVNR